MLRFLYSGVSGMKANQTKMDVIGNNISNVGTTGFKAGRVRFQDMLSQTQSDAMAPTTNQGGVNPSQVGLGVKLAGIDTIMNQGMMQPTGSNLDFAIDGDGYFMVGKGPSVYNDGTIDVNQSVGMHNVDTNSLSKSNMDLMYTRDGSFTKDDDGNLLTSNGYRVMGYSLTNDDTNMAATSKEPNGVSTGGFTFQFGPGAQLNGYSIALGKIGPDTIASADIDTQNKLIILNGDFSGSDGITASQAKTAINKALSSAGISQTVNVNGNLTVIRNIASDTVKGGADSQAPGSVSSAGFTFDFDTGSQLNGYVIELGDVKAGNSVSANVDTANKKIILNGDFVTSNAVSTNALKNAINLALSSQNITQTVNNVTGTAITIPQITSTTDNKGSTPKTATVTGTLNGLALTLSDGGGLNGYTIKLGTTSANTTTSATIDQNTKVITLNGDFSGTKDIPTLSNEIKTKLNAALASANISQPTVTAVTGTAFDYTSSSVSVGTDGADNAAPSDVTVGGINFSFNNGTTFNGYTVQLGNIGAGTTTDATIDKNARTITIDGDFITPNGFRTSDLQTILNTKVAAAGLDGTTAYPAGSVKITVSGSPKNYTGILSSTISGGSDLQSPTNVQAEGFTFQITPGAGLNGYDIEVGKITAGTPTTAEIDTDKKKIIINGDFTSPNSISSNAIQTAINDQLTAKGISQAISVTGSPVTINGVQSSAASGGTPVQSIDNNGIINFVDGTKELKSYDGCLKSLKIPDKIYDAGNNQYLKITKYTVDKNGVINAVLDDGRVAALGQIAMASFNNPAGLSKLGNNLYSQSVNSGDATLRSGVGTTGEDNSKGYGDALQGELEMSNVDLAEQFTDMIETTRAFQANAKVISSGDDILQDILNLKR